jgi:hypothetical protein
MMLLSPIAKIPILYIDGAAEVLGPPPKLERCQSPIHFKRKRYHQVTNFMSEEMMKARQIGVAIWQVKPLIKLDR